MLFTGPLVSPAYPDLTRPGGLPSFLVDLLDHLSATLKPMLPVDTWNTVFAQPLARQVIINLYPPGKGIAPHVDLPHRYADGVLGVNIVGSASMTFRRVRAKQSAAEGETISNSREAPRALESDAPEDIGGTGSLAGAGAASSPDQYDVHLPPRSVYVLTGPARWGWSHGIAERDHDVVQLEDGMRTTIMRDTRLSITFRWMKEDGDVLC